MSFTMMANSLLKISETFFPEEITIQFSVKFCFLSLYFYTLPLSSNGKVILPKEKTILR